MHLRLGSALAPAWAPFAEPTQAHGHGLLQVAILPAFQACAFKVVPNITLYYWFET